MDILIVDSSIHIIERLEEVLAETTCIVEVFTAISFMEAKQLYEEHKPAIVLLDIDMPLNESLTLLFRIKKRKTRTAVIILFNQLSDFLEDQCRMAGADYFLDKYHDYSRIPSIINEIAAKKHGS